MSESSTSSANAAAKPWAKEQNWIKDVLSKSGTELVQLSPNKAVKITKKVVKQNEKNSQTNTMVYYPSTPLIIKSEPSSHTQMCAPLRNHHDPQHTTQQQHVIASKTYTISNVNITTLQHHQQQQQQQQQHVLHNINSSNHQQPQQYLTNIKTELLPPGITVYATTPQPASLTPKPVTPSHPNPTSTTNNVSSSSSSTIASTTTGRKSNSNKPQFKCDQCGMTFGSKSAHTSHTKSHTKNSELSLVNAGNNSPNVGANSPSTVAILDVNDAGVPLGIPKTPQIKANANATTNGGDPYQCNVCQKTFAVPARLIRHYRTHTGERPFECEFCHKLFSVKENLQVHRRIHTKERPYKCDVCGRAFEHSGKLHRHMRIHTGERPHKCSVCDKTFIQSGQLVIHMRTHTGEKPYKCPVDGCGKGFTCSKQLKVHSRTHTGEKPYHCDICFRDFGYNHVLKLHRVQHYGSKCYKCTICDETFKSKKEMEAHIKGHAHEMPDDDEEVAANGNGTICSVSTSSGVETNSGPNSPQSPSSSIAPVPTTTTTTANSNTAKPRKERKEKYSSKQSAGRAASPGSPGSPISSSMSPSSSYASGSRLSAASPTSSAASPTMSLSLEADHHSRDSGVASASISCNNTRQLAAASLVDLSHQGGGFPTSDEMPTDLSVTQNHHNNSEEQQLHQQQQHKTHHQTLRHLNYHYQSSPSPQHHSQQPQHHSQQYHYLNPSTSPSHATELHHTATVSTQQQQQHHVRYDQQPTINPALLEAATIASRREDDVQQAAIQIMQLHHSQHKSNTSPLYNDLQHNLSSNRHHKSLITPRQHENAPADVVKSMVMTENLIEHYTRDELTRHVGGLSKGYAPVPKFEPSLHDNEIILRQVEAAIAPLRSSTNSPDRSSSPESDVMLMADRDVMTLPLRKRKVYMSDCKETGDNGNGNTNTKNLNHKVMRHSSVIQFAKAS